MPQFKRSKEPPKKYDVHKNLPQSYIPESRKRALEASKLADQIDDKKPKKRRWIKRTILAVFFVLFIPSAIFVGWNAHNVAQASEKIFGTGNLTRLLIPTKLSSQDGRVNILLVGYSKDDPGHAGAELTDSILIMSLDTEKKTGYMLSVPRDLYIEIPGYGAAKINEAYQAGERSDFKENGYPNGGVGLLEKTISEKFAIEFHYYALINYGTVKDIVSALDGISVKIDSKDPRGIYDPNFRPREGGPLKLKNGVQKINASEALRLTRARGSTFGSYGFAQSDFDRTKNQQAVIKGIKEELTWGLLLDPRKNPTIFNAFAENIKTDIKLSEVVPLYRLFNDISVDKLHSAGFRSDKVNLLPSYTTPTGQSALVPNGGVNSYDEIKKYIEDLNKKY
ncbi:MAG TPA: LCP family protein [Candidatus Saccharimonadales bacterium]|nr:LCP family protein [Candidatus Saccharimonadales bacterium]